MAYDPETPRLLPEYDDERSVTRRREAAFISVIVHLVVLVVLLLEPVIFPAARKALGVVEEQPPRRQVTYLAHPPDNQVLRERPKTGLPSDKDRLARMRPAEAPKLPPVPLPVKPAPERSPEKIPEKTLTAQAQPPPAPAPAQPAPDATRHNGPQPGTPAAPPIPTGDVRIEQPKLPVPSAGGTPGRALEETLRGMARNRSGGQAVGEGPSGTPGSNPRSQASVGEARILSDTMGVDFDPYLRRVVADIRRNWYAVMPEIARLGKRGRVAVVFEIHRDGSVPKLYLVTSSSSEPLDRAALAGISASAPFPPLPSEFRGPMVRLQVTFLYNMMLE